MERRNGSFLQKRNLFALAIILLLPSFVSAQVRTLMPMGNSITWGKVNRNAPPAGTHGYRDHLYNNLVGYSVAFVGPRTGNPYYNATYDNDAPYEGYFRDGARVNDFMPDSVYSAVGMLNAMDADSIPEIVILHVGTNNMFDDTDIGDYTTPNTVTYYLYQLVNSLLDFSKSGNQIEHLLLCKIIPYAPYVDFPNANQRVQEYNARLQEMVANLPSDKRNRIGEAGNIIDMFSPFRNNEETYYNYDIDGTHPNGAGYEAMADIFFSYIKNIIVPSLRDDFTASGGLNGINRWYAVPGIQLTGAGSIYCNEPTTSNWDNLAVWAKSQNANATTAGFASNCANFNTVAIAIGLNDTIPAQADGYMVWITGNTLRIYQIIDGVSGGAIDTYSMPGYGAGDSVRINYRPTKSAGVNFFDVTVNNQQTVTRRHNTTSFGQWTNFYSGVLFKDGSGSPPAASALIDFFKVETQLPDIIPPSQITDLSVYASTHNSITLLWQAPGNDGPVGTASSYDLRISTSPFTAVDFNQQDIVVGLPIPFAAGNNQIFEVTGLLAGIRYYFRLRAVDDWGNQGIPSNQVDWVTESAGVKVENFDGDLADWNFNSNEYGFDPRAGMEGEFTNLNSTGGWASNIAVYTARHNPETVKMVWGHAVTQGPPVGNNTENGGLALMLNSDQPDADGYFVFVRTTQQVIYLFPLVNGVPTSYIDKVTYTIKDEYGAIQYPQDGDTLAVVMNWENPAYNKFEVYVNDQKAGNRALYDEGKIHSVSTTGPPKFAGIFLSRQYNITGRNNNVDAFITISKIIGPGDIFEVSPSPSDGIVNTQTDVPITIKVIDGNQNPLPGAPVFFKLIEGQSGGDLGAPDVVEDPIRIEAEWGITNGTMEEISHPTASRGAYIISPAGGHHSGNSVIRFTVPESGTYWFWGRCVATAYRPSLWWIEIDGVEIGWESLKGDGYSKHANDWKWDRIQHYQSSQPYTKELQTGILHTMVINNGHSGAKLDKIILTRSSTYRPAGQDTTATLFTNVDGIARSTWKLGRKVGTNRVNVTTIGLNKTVPFATDGLPDVPQSIFKDTGTDNQSTTSGDTVTVRAILEDKHGNVTPDIEVQWRVTRGDATLLATKDTTDATGGTAVSLIAGVQDSIQQVSVTYNGYTGPTIVFSVNVTAGLIKQIQNLTQEEDKYYIGKRYSNILKVKVLNDIGEPVPNTAVTFGVKKGKVSVGVVQPKYTNVEGFVQDTLFTGTQHSVFEITAFAGGMTQTIIADTAFYLGDKLKYWGGATVGSVSDTLLHQLKVRVEDALNLPVEGHPVKFRTTGNGFQFPDESQEVTILTAFDGVASTNVRLGPIHGSYPNIVYATINDGFNPIDTTWFNINAKSSASSLIKIDGDGQTGIVNSRLPLPFKVQMVDVQKKPIVGQPVHFEITSKDRGRFDHTLLYYTTVMTDKNGYAQVLYVLGPEAGTNNNVIEARATNGINKLENSPIVFYASAKSSDADSIAADVAMEHIGVVGKPLTQKIRVRLFDRLQNAAFGEDVTFSVIGGGGVLNGSADTTKTIIVDNAGGIAEVVWTLGTQVGTRNNILQVTSSNGLLTLKGSPLYFYASGIPDVVSASRSMVEATTPHKALTSDTSRVTVTLLDSYGNAVPNKEVELKVTGGSNNFIHQPTEPTDEMGQTAGYLISLTSGEKLITATDTDDEIQLENTATVIFLANTAAKIKASSGDAQTGNIGTILQNPLIVKVTDGNDNGVAYSAVTFEVIGNGKIMEPQPVISDIDGLASAHLIFGSETGPYMVKVSAKDQAGFHLQGSPVYFSATAKVGTAITMIPGSIFTQTGEAGKKLPEPFTVAVLDLQNKSVFNVPVTFEIVDGGAYINTQQPVFTNEYGQASVYVYADTEAGKTSWITAVNEGLAGSPVSFSAISTAGSARQLHLESGNNQTGYIGENLPAQLVVKTTDKYGNVVKDFPITFEIMEGDATIAGGQSSTVLSNTSGLAAVTVKAGFVRGNVKVEARGKFLNNSPVEFILFVESPIATRIEKLSGWQSGDKQKGTVGQQFVDPLRVRVVDAYNNPVPGRTVFFNKDEGVGQLVGSAAVKSDEYGIAEAYFHAGSSPGTTVASASMINKVVFNLETVYNLHSPQLSKVNIPATDITSEDDEYVLGLLATDADGDPLTFQLANVFPPEGVTIEKNSENSAIFYWKPTLDQAGVYPLIFRVIDGKGGSDQATMELTVRNVNQSPRITSTYPVQSDTLVKSGRIVEFKVEAEDPDGDPLSYTWKVGGVKQSEKTNVFEYNVPKYFSGNQTVDVFVSDYLGFDSEGTHRWQLSVIVSVQLSHYTAQFEPRTRAVHVKWETVKENMNKGFDVYRSLTYGGDYIKLNEDMIPTKNGGEYLFIDETIQVGRSYWYKLVDTDNTGYQTDYEPVQVMIPVPDQFDLSQNYPNPFNPQTKIQFQLPERNHVKLVIYNMMGQQISMLINEVREAGYYTVKWNGKDESGRDVSTGIYIYRLISDKKVLTRRMVKMK